MNRTWHLYVLLLANGGAYIGITTDPARRFQEHRERRCSDVWEKWGEPTHLFVVATYIGYSKARAAEHLWHRQVGHAY